MTVILIKMVDCQLKWLFEWRVYKVSLFVCYRSVYDSDIKQKHNLNVIEEVAEIDNKIKIDTLCIITSYAFIEDLAYVVYIN